MAKRPKYPFPIGSNVTWAQRAPKNWRQIYTPGPMIVISARWHDGIPNEYAKMFHKDGMGITPGWIVTIEYDADSGMPRDPPLSLLFGKTRLQIEIHEKWLMQASNGDT